MARSRNLSAPAKRQRLRADSLQRSLLAVSRACPIGSDVRVWPGTVGVGPGTPATVLEPGAHVVPGIGIVVPVSGQRKPVSATRVRNASADVASSFDQPEVFP